MESSRYTAIVDRHWATSTPGQFAILRSPKGVTVKHGTLAEMETLADRYNATLDRHDAIYDAYEAAGYRIERDLPTGAARYRQVNSRAIRIVDGGGDVVARYDSIDDAPTPAAPTEGGPAPVEAAAAARPVLGTITDGQAAKIWSLVQADAHEGCWFDGPTTLDGIQAMSREDASTYITAMQEG